MYDLFTFQSGYIQITKTIKEDDSQVALHSNLVIFKFEHDHLIGHAHNFTFQSGYIQILKSWVGYTEKDTLYIPIWLYSNPYPIIPSIQAILNHIFCLPIYLQVHNDYLVYSLLLLIILLPLFYNICRTLYIL